MDEDGDWVTISTPEEMRKSFQAQKNAGKNTPIFGILCLAPATPAPTWEGPAAAPTAPHVSEAPSKEHAHAHPAPQECPKTHFSEAPHVHQGWAATPQAPHSHHAEEHHPSHPHAEDPHHPTHPGWKHGAPQWHHPQKCGGGGGKWEGPHHHWAEKMKWWRAMMHHHHANKHWGASHCGKW